MHRQPGDPRRRARHGASHRRCTVRPFRHECIVEIHRELGTEKRDAILGFSKLRSVTWYRRCQVVNLEYSNKQLGRLCPVLDVLDIGNLEPVRKCGIVWIQMHIP